MKIAIVGGTHGNEFTGIEVCRALSEKSANYVNEYQTFIANPLAYEKKVRYVDSDLNRAYGIHSNPIGNEKERSDFLKGEIIGKFDFLVDLHSTTSHMGSTLILTDNDEKSFKAACFIKENFPHYKLIYAAVDENNYYTPNMTGAGLTVEIGPIANNIVKSSFVLDNLDIVEALLNFDFKQEFDYSKFEAFVEIDKLEYPDEGNFFIHPNLEGKDFCELKTGDPLFINAKREVKNFSYTGHDIVYPMFISEAAYLEKNIALEICEKKLLSDLIH